MLSQYYTNTDRSDVSIPNMADSANFPSPDRHLQHNLAAIAILALFGLGLGGRSGQQGGAQHQQDQ